MKITAGTIANYNDTESNTVLQSLPWSITDDEGALLLEGNQSFPLDASTDDLRAFLSKRLATYQSDVATYDSAQALQAGLDNAANVASEINGLAITA